MTASAQVVLRSASGAEIRPDTVVTAENVDRFAPPAAAVETAKAAFKKAGFEVGNMVGNSFSITAPAARFEEFFGAELRRSDESGIEVLASDGAASSDLPMTDLPPDLREIVHSVLFMQPPEFGPSDFFP